MLNYNWTNDKYDVRSINWHDHENQCESKKVGTIYER